MISILFIGLASALLVFAIIARLPGDGRKKAKKAEKAEIVKQLLALSERENTMSETAPSARPQRQLHSVSARPGNVPRKSAAKTSQPIRSSR
jgi:hypothetical protein